jgi:putative membrane protein
MHAIRTTHLAAVFAFLSIACAPTSDAEPAPPAAPQITDAQIAAIVVAANATDADLGEFAATRATNPSIQEFAKTMTRDHRAVNAQAAALVARLGVTPVETDVSRKLVSDGNAFRAELSQKTGAAFDRAYIEHEVVYHQAVIDAVDQTLLPNVQNAELKQAITDVRPALVAHLRHAQQLQATLR